MVKTTTFLSQINQDPHIQAPPFINYIPSGITSLGTKMFSCVKHVRYLLPHKLMRR